MSIRSTVGSVLNRNRGSNLEAEREAIVQKGSQEKFESKNNTKIIDISISIYNWKEPCYIEALYNIA